MLKSALCKGWVGSVSSEAGHASLYHFIGKNTMEIYPHLRARCRLNRVRQTNAAFEMQNRPGGDPYQIVTDLTLRSHFVNILNLIIKTWVIGWLTCSTIRHQILSLKANLRIVSNSILEPSYVGLMLSIIVTPVNLVPFYMLISHFTLIWAYFSSLLDVLRLRCSGLAF